MLTTKLTNIAEAIRTKTGKTDKMLLDTMPSEILSIETGGGEGSNLDILRYVTNAGIISLNVFGKSDVVLNLDNVTNFANMFSITTEENRNNTVEHLTINCPNLVTSFLNTFVCAYALRDLTLKRITLNVNTQNVTAFQSTFNCLIALEVIDGFPLNLTKATTTLNIFNYCNALKEVRFVENTISVAMNLNSCGNLSNDTINSIIDGLVDLTGTTAQTLKFNTAVRDALTDEQIARVTSKNWSLT